MEWRETRSRAHLKLLALEDVAVSTTGLARSAGEGGVETTSSELSRESLVDLGVLLLLIQAALSVVGELLLLTGLDGGLALFGDGLGVLM
jgi:hypothetical protein